MSNRTASGRATGQKWLVALLACTFLLTAGCSLMPSWAGGAGGAVAPDVPKQTATGEVLDEVTGLMVEMRWWMLIALLFFPSARRALGGMLTAFFGMFRSAFGSASGWLSARSRAKSKDGRSE